MKSGRDGNRGLSLRSYIAASTSTSKNSTTMSIKTLEKNLAGCEGGRQCKNVME